MHDWRDGAFPPESFPPDPARGGQRVPSASRRMPSTPGQSGARRPRQGDPRQGKPGTSGTLRRPDAARRTLGDVPQPPSASRQLPAVPTANGVPTRQPIPGALIRQQTTRIPATRAPMRTSSHTRALVTSLAVVLTVVVTLAFGATHALQNGDDNGGGSATAHATTPAGQATAGGTPPPSGSAPRSAWAASAGAIVYVPPPPTPKPSAGPTGVGLNYGIQPCHDKIVFPANISQWAVPNGCYANVYVPNPANYPARPTFGYCNWWVRENHLSNYNITMGSEVYLGTTPAPGDAIFFDGGVQGASADGHWAELVAVAPDHYWFLLGEMNFAWRGAGFGRIDYRYAHVGPGVRFYR